MKRISFLAAGAALVLGVTAGCGQITTPVTLDTTMLPAVTATTTAAVQPHVFVNLSILTGQMTGKPGWPSYVPADFTVPAHATVTVTIRDFDSGPVTVPAANLRVQGTVGDTMTVVNGLLGSLAGLPATTVSAAPANDVAHTFTVPALGLNVPVPPSSTVTFTFKTGAPGTYTWQCFAPCGTGTSGWSGPMDTAGYMKGTITVHA